MVSSASSSSINFENNLNGEAPIYLRILLGKKANLFIWIVARICIQQRLKLYAQSYIAIRAKFCLGIKMIRKILIANRGEIACRIASTAKVMGIATVAVYSDVDKGSLHVNSCDQAVHIGGSQAADSYLNISSIINAAVDTNSDAIHPGYGFLSENASFADACMKAGIIFIGPSASNINDMGSKAISKVVLAKANIPLVPGYHGCEQSLDYLKARAEEIGYPVLIKASAGGGGRGMRLVESSKNIDESLTLAQKEAKAAFADDRLLIEKYIKKPRHVEVQIFGDKFGNLVHLFERDCSIQRRHQKVLEEAPAPEISSDIRRALFQTALTVAQTIKYQGAGTVEFVLNQEGFYFIEMNTRLQVEHSVTELITGVDLVEWQIRVANGEVLPLTQEEIKQNGHAFEARLYAEDPTDFRPQTGIISHLKLPSKKVRIDCGVRKGDTVSVYYDPMIAKLSAHGSNRTEALRILTSALTETEIAGLVSNQSFLTRLVRHKAFLKPVLHTNFIDEHSEQLLAKTLPLSGDLLILLAAAILQKRTRMDHGRIVSSRSKSTPWDLKNGWRLNALNRHKVIICDADANHEILLSISNDDYEVIEPSPRKKYTIKVDWHNEKYCTVTHSQSNSLSRLNICLEGRAATLFLQDGARQISWLDSFSVKNENVDVENSLKAPMPGKIISIEKYGGDKARRGETLLVLEAMKMQHAILAPADGTVKEMHFAESDVVNEGDELLDFEADPST